jgi:two-component system phosphate regulon response regulator PhoB
MVRQLREGPPTLRSHITLVLDEDSAEMRRRALRAGADDYLPGPFSAAGILERLQRYKIGRGATTGAPPRIASGELIVDQEAHRVRWRGQRVALSPGEFQLLAHFLQNPDRLFTRSGLITALGKADHMVDKRTVDVWIGRLRRSLVAQGVPDRLRTVRAMGYVFDSLEQDMGSSREI